MLVIVNSAKGSTITMPRATPLITPLYSREVETVNMYLFKHVSMYPTQLIFDSADDLLRTNINSN